MFQVLRRIQGQSAFNEFEFLKRDDDDDLRPMPTLTSISTLKEEMKVAPGTVRPTLSAAIRRFVDSAAAVIYV